MECERESELLHRAMDGCSTTLQQLLLLAYHRLETQIRRKFPAELKGQIGVSDVIQDTFLRAFRHIGEFRGSDVHSFHGWLAAIAERRLRDLIKQHRTLKRGGGRQAVAPASGGDGSPCGLLAMLAQHQHTPSRSMARREGAAALQVAWAALEEDYRQALDLRYIQGLSAAAAAAQMGRTDRAVHMLCYRGLRRLRELLGSTSDFLSHRA